MGRGGRGERGGVALATLLCLGCTTPTEQPASGSGTRDAGRGSDLGDREPSAPGWSKAGELSRSELEEVGRLRSAFERGLSLGKEALADALNRVLVAEGLPARYAGSTTLGLELAEPAPGRPCPLPPADEAGERSGPDCRSLVDRAVVRAYGRVTDLHVLHPLVDSPEPERAAPWYEEGMLTGIDNEAQLARQHLLAEHACGSGYLAEAERGGIEVGRQVFVEALVGVIGGLGYPASYPAGLHAAEVCDVGPALLAPARTAATDRLPAEAERRPACPGYEPADAVAGGRLAEVDARYAEGLRRGVLCELSRATELLFLAVPCAPGTRAMDTGR